MKKTISRVFGLILAILLVTFLGLSACSKKSENTDNPSSPAPNSSKLTQSVSSTAGPASTTTAKPVTSNNSPGKVIKLKTVSFVDQQGIGSEAFKVLVPTDWQSEGGVTWLMDSPTMPAVSQFRIWNPAGSEQFQVFPNQAFFWTDNPITFQMFPAGSKYFGNEVREPLSALAALKQIVIPRLRPNVQNIKIITEQDLTSLINQAGSNVQSALPTSSEIARIRVEYLENNKVLEDEIYCMVEATFIPLQTIYGPKTNIMWSVSYIGSFRAEKGKLDNSAGVLKAISDSVTLNIQWFNKYVQVVDYLIKMNIQQIRNIGQLGSIIAQTGSEIRQENLDLYNQRQETNDRISNQFSEYLRGVDSYYNPNEEKNIELPTGYDNVWVDKSGNYVLSDNPNYNPNIGSTQNYQKLEKAKR